MAADPDPAERFAALVAALSSEDGVSPPEAERRRFGSAALKVDGRIFAMLSDGALVVKLPRPRVDELVDQGDGQPYTGGKDRPMREWVAVGADRHHRWTALAGEALAFVRGR